MPSPFLNPLAPNPHQAHACSASQKALSYVCAAAAQRLGIEGGENLCPLATAQANVYFVHLGGNCRLSRSTAPTLILTSFKK